MGEVLSLPAFRVNNAPHAALTSNNYFLSSSLLLVLCHVHEGRVPAALLTWLHVEPMIIATNMMISAVFIAPIKETDGRLFFFSVNEVKIITLETTSGVFYTSTL